MDNEDKSRNQDKGHFWTTLPGILTALAGFITALTALIAGLHQTGIVGTKTDLPNSPPSPIQSTPTPLPPTPPSPSLTPSPSATSTLEGKYSLAWAAQPGTQCYSGSIADLIISRDGFMQGYLANNSPDHIFSGKVNSDMTWSATLVGGYEFNGTLENGVLSGKYTAPSGITQCQGTVKGFKQPS
jgi:hypothetical protein